MTPSPLRTTLRQDTHDAHARVDALLGGGIADLETYRRYPSGMQRFLAACEDALLPAWPMAPLQALLADDMQALAVGPTPSLAAPLPATDEPSRLGVAYVVGGASVGARQLARQAEALGFGPGRAASFLHGFAQGSMWNGVLASLDAARLDPHQTDRCRAAAVAAFATAEAAFGGLEELR